MPYLKTLDQRHGIRISGSAVNVGSHPDNHIPIRPPFVVASRQFTLMESGGRYMIQNADPAGRTHVNGKPVAEGWLNDGDVIHAGDLALLFLNEKEGEDDPVLAKQRASTPFQASLPEPPPLAPTMLLPTSQSEDEAAAVTEAEPTDYDAVAVSTLDEHATTPIDDANRIATTGLKAEAKKAKDKPLAPIWLVVILVTLAYAWLQNGSAVSDWVSGMQRLKPDQTEANVRLPRPLSPALDQHFRAVSLVTTLPPDSYASLALAEFLEKTNNPWAKERIEKQVVSALTPVITNAKQIERLTLIDGGIAASRTIILTLKEKVSMATLLKGVGDTVLKPATIGGFPANRLTTGPERFRNIVEISEGTLIISDASESKLAAHFELAAKVKRPTGLVAMSRRWPSGFLASVPQERLTEFGGPQNFSSLSTAPLIGVEFEPLPVASITLSTDKALRETLLNDWTSRPDQMAAQLIGVGIISDVKVGTRGDCIQVNGLTGSATLLDEIWKKYFTDFDVKFRPMGLAVNQ